MQEKVKTTKRNGLLAVLLAAVMLLAGIIASVAWQSSPITANAETPFTTTPMIAAGYSYTVALKDDGTVWTWGRNNYGQLGNNSTENKSTPVQVLGKDGSGFLTDVIAIAAGYSYTVALKDDGTVWAWGYNNYGQLGNGESGTGKNKTTPVQANIDNVAAIAAGQIQSRLKRRHGLDLGF